MTRNDYACMSWHQRQRHNDRLRAETAALRAEADQARADRDAWIPEDINTITWVAETVAEAKRILAQMPPDPEAEAHRVTLWQAQRKDT